MIKQSKVSRRFTARLQGVFNEAPTMNRSVCLISRLDYSVRLRASIRTQRIWSNRLNVALNASPLANRMCHSEHLRTITVCAFLCMFTSKVRISDRVLSEEPNEVELNQTNSKRIPNEIKEFTVIFQSDIGCNLINSLPWYQKLKLDLWITDHRAWNNSDDRSSLKEKVNFCLCTYRPLSMQSCWTNSTQPSWSSACCSVCQGSQVPSISPMSSSSTTSSTTSVATSAMTSVSWLSLGQ